MLDSNVFIAAVRDPRKQTETLRLITKIIEDPNIALVADEFLVEEMLRYAELLRSQTVVTIVAALLAKTSITMVPEGLFRVCKRYLSTTDLADLMHAAACLKTGSILITNDRHFDKIRDEGIVRVWSITEAIKQLLGQRSSNSRQLQSDLGNDF